MLDNFSLINQTVTVMVAQTTFTVLSTPEQRYRIEYLEKAEACLKPGMRGSLISCSAHPLLLSYNSRLVEVYVNSRPQDADGLLTEIRERIEAVFQGWRDWRCVLSGKGNAGEVQLRQNLLDGSGLLLPGAPALVAQAVIEACTEYGALTYVRGDIENMLPVTSSFHLLLIDKGYVIAKGFRVIELSKEKPRLPGQ
jgi:hypothetical protein